MEGNTFYVTTPIYYVNGKPHIGHAYTTIAADVLKRYCAAQGKETFFQIGTDENSLKNVEAAEKTGRAVADYIDAMSAEWKQTWDKLGIDYDDFIRTTEDRHAKAVEKFWAAVEESGDIYKGSYKGLYCVGCEEFKTESSLVDGKCPDHLTEPQVIEEENYFFKASKYRDALLKHIDENPEFVQPKSRRNEIRNYIEEHFDDVSISRESLDWGIRVPGSEKDVVYVWFDALINYLSVIGYGTDDAQFEKWWPAQVQLVGKDIIKFHCALWPAMLMSAGLPLPERVFAHGHFTVEGQKISKSLGNAIDPVELCEKYGNDVVRYFLLSEITFGGDGNFSEERLREVYASDLANGVGNLVSRVTNMIDKYFEGELEAKPETEDAFSEYVHAYSTHMDAIELHAAAKAIVHGVVGEANEYIEQNQPWALAKTDEARLKEVLQHALYALQIIAEYIGPFMPETAAKVREAIEGDTITKAAPLFPRLED